MVLACVQKSPTKRKKVYVDMETDLFLEFRDCDHFHKEVLIERVKGINEVTGGYLDVFESGRGHLTLKCTKCSRLRIIFEKDDSPSRTSYSWRQTLKRYHAEYCLSHYKQRVSF